ncbi:hypothetical protein KR100_14480 [Synechococcus sp. KORDI-100]|nr:hypothetical protein KR100_14480 [Synechococcus sp. KORDI-100]
MLVQDSDLEYLELEAALLDQELDLMLDLDSAPDLGWDWDWDLDLDWERSHRRCF